MINRYYVYLIQNENGKVYTGFTTNISNRMIQHNSDMSGYTKGKGPWELAWYAAFKNKEKALEFESYLKSGSGYAFSRKRFL